MKISPFSVCSPSMNSPRVGPRYERRRAGSDSSRSFGRARPGKGVRRCRSASTRSIELHLEAASLPVELQSGRRLPHEQVDANSRRALPPLAPPTARVSWARTPLPPRAASRAQCPSSSSPQHSANSGSGFHGQVGDEDEFPGDQGGGAGEKEAGPEKQQTLAEIVKAAESALGLVRGVVRRRDESDVEEHAAAISSPDSEGSSVKQDPQAPDWIKRFSMSTGWTLES